MKTGYKRKITATLMMIMLLILCCCSNQGTRTAEAVYLGVENYGAEEVNKDTKETFSYRFEVNGKEESLKVGNGAMNEEGEYTYPIQNLLKEG